MTIDSLAYALKPLLLVLLLPPVPALIVIAIGAWLIRRRARLGAGLVALGVLGAWLGACGGTAQWLTRHALDAPPGLDWRAMMALRQRSLDKGDVAVLVLGAGIRDYAPEYLGAGLKPLTLERLRYGVWLARHIDAPLGFTGGVGWTTEHKRFPEATVAKQVAGGEFKLPLRWAEDRSRDTRENASFSLPILKADGVREVVVVTHVEHMPRALGNFRDAARQLGDIEIVAAPMGLVADGMSRPLDWCPDGDGLSKVRYLVYEWLGRISGH